MPVFKTQRELDRATNRLLGRFFKSMFLVTVLFLVAIAVHYLLGWW